MALNPVPVGDRIATYLFENPLMAAGTAATLAEIKEIWEHVMGFIYTDLQASLQVEPGTFEIVGVSAGPDTITVTGLGGPAL